MSDNIIIHHDGPHTVVPLNERSKTITVAFQLRIPRKMKRSELETYIEGILDGSIHAIPSSSVRLYKERVEVFMP